MSNEFIREARYVVLKIADVMKCLTVSELIELRHIQTKVEEHRASNGEPQRLLAEEFGVSRPTITRLVNGSTWNGELNEGIDRM